MNENQKENKRKCAFYVSEYHCNLIISNYMKEKEDKQFVVFTEKNQEENIKKIVDVLDFNEDSKNKLLNLNWDNNIEKNIEIIRNGINEQKDISIFIQGSENYIKNINSNMENSNFVYDKLEVIDCYEFGEVFSKIKNIRQNYNGSLNISAY